jgi:inosine/xanthosine triphosphate pyrophosphatase family protein
MSNKLFFVSSNETKVREAQHILGFPINIASIDLTEIQELDIEEIVKQKVIDAYKEIKQQGLLPVVPKTFSYSSIRSITKLILISY